MDLSRSDSTIIVDLVTVMKVDPNTLNDENAGVCIFCRAHRLFSAAPTGFLFSARPEF